MYENGCRNAGQLRGLYANLFSARQIPGKLALNSKPHNIVKTLRSDKHFEAPGIISVSERYGRCSQNRCVKKNELFQIRLSRNFKTTQEGENAAKIRH